MGTREVLVTRQHIPEAIELIKIVKTELCRTMNHRAIINSFTDYEDLILSTTTTDNWKPFDIQLAIETTNSPYTDHHHKRMRLPKNNRKSSNKSYAEVTCANPQPNNVCNTIYTLPTNSTTSTITSLSRTTESNSLQNSHNRSTQDLNQTSLTSLLSEIKTLHDNLHNLSSTVASNKSHHQTEMEQFENRFSSKLQTTCEEQ
jgi:hypothetical protein